MNQLLAQKPNVAWPNLVARGGFVPFRFNPYTGQRGVLNGGSDYYQDLIIWSLPAAMAGTDLGAPCKSGGLIDRVRRAASGGSG